MKKPYTIWRPFKYFIIINIVILAAVNLYFYRSLSQFYLSQSVAELSTRAKVFNLEIGDLALTPANVARLDESARKLGSATASRITVMDTHGNVLGDTLETPLAMENHLVRKEIAEALTGVTGTDIRVSTTTKQKTLYVAEPLLSDGEIIGVSRAARTIRDMENRQSSMLRNILLFNLLVLAVLILISYLISRRYTKPLLYMEHKARNLAQGDFDVRVKPPKVPEFKVLADSFNYMAGALEDRIRTITDQRNSLNVVLNSMGDALLVISADETIGEINPAASRWFNISRDDALGRDLRAVVRYSAMQDFMLKALAGGLALGEDITVIAADGCEHTLRLKSSPIDNEARKGCVIVFYDITQTRKAEKMRRDFVANVSHEIRTPLAAIQVSAEALDYSGLLQEHPEQQFINSIMQHSERLGNLVTDLLFLSRVEQYPEEFETETVLLQPVLYRAADGLAAKLSAQRARINIDCPADLALPLNSRLIELALINLIDNALKYSAPDKDVTVSAHQADGLVHICVKDHGEGIPAEHLSRLFERFYRVDAARSRQTGGTGLGLAIVKHIAQAHNGRAEVYSTPGEGSVFSLILPGDI